MRRRRSLRIALVIASGSTALFVLSTLFSFGIATHRSRVLGWNASRPGDGLVQAVCYHGQFHLTIDFGPSRAPTPRTWHAGVEYLPGLRFDVRATDRFNSKLGFDAFLVQGYTYFGLSVSWLYPTLLAWLLVWVLARRRLPDDGHCPGCGYDLRASPQRCPECGRTVTPAPAAAAPPA